MSVTNVNNADAIEQAARAEIAKEQADAAKKKITGVLRELAVAHSVVAALELKLVDIKRQIADGTI